MRVCLSKNFLGDVNSASSHITFSVARVMNHHHALVVYANKHICGTGGIAVLDSSPEEHAGSNIN